LILKRPWPLKGGVGKTALGVKGAFLALQKFFTVARYAEKVMSHEQLSRIFQAQAIPKALAAAMMIPCPRGRRSKRQIHGS
jgi:hypothetical protein